ncbi:MAG: Spy/CpxP family protein refolding chaperone [Rhodoplanes sp.]|uniref:Spy/CpxP family protein refolding chaperone n=1 Tax=Rhodoplanes sp. TaxID=1968906 RepID=UPI0018406414|nr:Spy/CpxP family protein refolding chaperone [Rhodoplanes sp.]NVO17153.1 Spy/CpxP family protein refolding chaperone [Rhodoplanes sp.]
MTDHLPGPLPASASQPQAPAKRRRLAPYVIAAVLAGAVGLGAFATTSFSQGMGMGFGPHFGQGGPGFGPGFGRGAFDPAQAEQRADRMVRHLAVELDATNEQQDKLRTIVKAAVKDVLPMREKLMAARGQARDLLVAQTVDRAAIEKLRAEQITLADAASKRVAQALGDAAEVLTPEQRRKLNDRLPPAGFMRGWSRG